MIASQARLFQPIDVSQRNILRILSTYFNKPLPAHCSGFTVLCLYSIWLQTEPTNYLPRMDFQWFIGTLKKIATMDKESGLIMQKDHENFVHLYKLVKHFQFPARYMNNVLQGDIDQILRCMDTNKKIAKREYSIAGCFVSDDLIKIHTVTNDDGFEITNSILSQLAQNKRLIYIQSHDHAAGFIKIEKSIVFYNSNNEDGPAIINANDIQTLAKMIFDAFMFDAEQPSPIAFRVYSFESDNVIYIDQDKLLPTHHSDLSKGYGDNMTALHMAAFIGCMASLCHHLSQDVNINAQDSIGFTALHYAVLRQDVNCVTTLISHGADVNVVGFQKSETPLSIALELGNAEITALLISAGAFNPRNDAQFPLPSHV